MDIQVFRSRPEGGFGSHDPLGGQGPAPSTRIPIPWALVLGAILSLVLAACATTPPPCEPREAADEAMARVQGGERTYQVTLITGDTVTYTVMDDGRSAVTVEEAPRPEGWPEATILIDEPSGDDLYVYPADARAFIAAGVLDRELFNITGLVAQGLDDGSRDDLPVIILYGHGASTEAITRNTRALAGSEHALTLSSVGGAGVEVDRGRSGEFWAQITAGALDRDVAGGQPLRFGGGVERIVLDRKIYPDLDDSVPMVGAPEAWQADLTGQGIRVAVIDTGIDAAHPDLAGRVVAEANFTDSDTPSDRHGHGTHVAGIIAGDGAASDGLYTGVAPDAFLLNVKVLDDNGEGQSSWVIAGMEWAAAQGAQVINASVGNGPTDGTDPLSLAVDSLTELHDVLFVISAGNYGLQGDFSVGTPGAAGAALTVGSVDKSGELAGNSSRGPRLGDFAIKPDITAPGVGIVAARADGSTIGPPVDTRYMRLSGTSMAAPHVTGAAAILLQRQPGLSAAELKSALATSAIPHDELDVYQQGGGRLDIPAMLDTPVLAWPVPLDLGYFPYPHDDTGPLETEVRYTNHGDGPVTLALSLEVASRDGAVADPDMLTVSPANFELAPGETESATVTLDVREGDFGLYGGYLLASDGDGEIVSRNPLGYFKEGERHTLTVEGIRRDGQPAAGAASLSGFQVLNVEDASVFSGTFAFEEGQATVRVPPGTYSVLGMVNTYHPEAEELGLYITLEWVLAGDPEIEVSEDTRVVLDARQAGEITFETPQHDTEPIDDFYRLTYRREAADGGGQSGGLSGTVSLGNHPAGSLRRFAVATAPVEKGGFELLYDARLVARDQGNASPILYDLAVVEQDRIPENLHFRAEPDALVRLGNRIHSDIDDHQYVEIRHFWRPWQTTSNNSARPVTVPVERTEYLVGGDTRYLQRMDAAGQNATTGPGLMREQPTYYSPGTECHQSWFRQPARPGVREFGPARPDVPVLRRNDTLVLELPEWTDSHVGHYGWMHPAVDTVAFRYFIDGELKAQAPRPRGEFEMRSDPAEYRLDLRVARDAPWWTTSTETHTVWTFRSAAPEDGGSDFVPLMLVDYELELDLLNTLKPGSRHAVVRVRHQPGAEPRPMRQVRLWTSLNDGRTWEEQAGSAQSDGEYRFRLIHTGPDAPDGRVSLRVEATDGDGNQVEQQIIRAYRH